MNTKYKKIFITAILFIAGMPCLFSQEEQLIMNAIKTEVDRNLSGLKIGNLLPPFYISYVLLDNEQLTMSASGGSLTNSSNYRTRLGIPFVLVGDFFRNNATYLTYADLNSYPGQVCLDNDPTGIATSIWTALDKKYKQAAENFESKNAFYKQEKQLDEEEALPDFDDAPAPNLILPPAKMNMDVSYWENYIKKGSEVFNKYPEILTANVDLNFRNTMAYYYDTKNGQYALPLPNYKIWITLSAQAADGQEVGNEWYIEHTSDDSIPDLKSFVASCEQYANEIMKLKNAPKIQESYSGPVLLEGKAVEWAVQNQFFVNNALIAKRKPVAGPAVISSYPPNSPVLKGNELETMMNKEIISKELNIKSLTGTETYNGVKLEGYYPLDFEGVAPDKEMLLVEKGVMRGLLSGKIPTIKAPHSNGHTRYNFSNRAVVAPGNVHVYGEHPVSKDELKQQLLDAAKEAGYDYAYIIRRMKPDKIVAIYKVYVADGREELVRGAILKDFNMKSFKQVTGVSKEEFIVNNALFGQIATFILPQFMLFKELEVLKDNNVALKKPYVVAQPGNK
ncbi:MAG: hypothetical protein FWD60_09085 [Candidatus Azobacteroides sp.]|nr:hypothetical protein [Candidatus Azobacteroides sp.]